MKLYDLLPDDLEIYYIQLTDYLKKGKGEMKAMVTKKLDMKIANRVK